MIERLMAWLRGDPAYADPDPLVRAALRTGRREWPTEGGGTLRLLSPDYELRMTTEERWALRNAEAREAGCPCGKPATVCRTLPEAAAYGINMQQWTCEEHVGYDAVCWTERDGARTGVTFTFKHPQPCPAGEDYGSGGKIGQPPSHFYCTHRMHEETM